MHVPVSVVVGFALLLTSASLEAQSVPPPAGLPATAIPRDALALPGDVLPPPLSVVIAPPVPVAPYSPPPPPTPPPPVGPGLAKALVAAQAALAKCQADGLRVGVAVSDSAGVVMLGLQMEGANPGRIFFAGRKNLVALEFGTPSSAVREKLRANDFATLSRVKPAMVVFAGSVPLVVDGKVIGAIGVSGATSAQDEVCAAAGAAAFAAHP